MRRLPPQVEQEILKRALQGATYREIAREFGMSIATVSRVIEDARKKMPDVDSLRELSILLRKAGLTVFDATRACRLMESLTKWGISFEELSDYVRLNEM
ncbi:MAG: sigma-70 region 4 domain-containing protein, partial [Candidatus Bathyarchaeia archaeon]